MMAPLHGRCVRRHDSTLPRSHPTCAHRTNVSRETSGKGPGVRGGGRRERRRRSRRPRREAPSA
ncbi:hypothetical protein C1856_12125, partial [Eggerthella lenta]